MSQLYLNGIGPAIEQAAKAYNSKRHREGHSFEIKVQCVRETAAFLADSPERIEAYWHAHVATAPWFDEDKEHIVVFALNARRIITAHNLVSVGSVDTAVVHAREVFRPLVAVAACAFVIAHNHPSGDPQPSEADIKVTRDLIRASQMMNITLLDHVVIGEANDNHPSRYSLRELGYFHS